MFLQPTLLSYLGKRARRKFSLPLDVSEPGGVPEPFGKWIAVYFQLGYLGKKEWVQNKLISKVKEAESEIVFFFSFPTDPSNTLMSASIMRSDLSEGQVHRCTGSWLR